ncbi:Ig-like domain-containing protein [Priestia sp. 40]
MINSDGTFTYSPNPSFVGTDSFSVFAQRSSWKPGVWNYYCRNSVSRFTD